MHLVTICKMDFYKRQDSVDGNETNKTYNLFRH